MIDKDEYPQTAELERRCVQMLADLWNAPTDGTAGRLLGHRIVRGVHARGHGRQVAVAGQAARRPASPTDRPNMVCGPVQVVWHKFAKYWDIEMREIPMSPGQLLHGRRADAGPGGREHHHGGADLRGDLHRLLRAGPRAVPGPRQAAGGHRARHRHPRRRGQRRLSGSVLRPGRACGTSGSPGSSRSAPRATSSGWPRSVSAGCCGGTPPTCPTTSSST